MFPIAGETAGPNGLKFSRKPMDTLGVTKAIKIQNFVFFKNRFFKLKFFFNSTGNVEPSSSNL